MQRYMLDTNICIYLMKHQPTSVANRLARQRVGDVIISAITFAELQFGVLASKDPAGHRTHLTDLVESIPVMPFDADSATAYGPIRYATRERKRDQLDKLIAAHARALNAILVTNNVRDFSVYPTLQIENWVDDDDSR